MYVLHLYFENILSTIWVFAMRNYVLFHIGNAFSQIMYIQCVICKLHIFFWKLVSYSIILFLRFIYLFERQSDREWETQWEGSCIYVSLAQWPQWLELGCSKAKSHKLPLHVPQGWRDPSPGTSFHCFVTYVS